eukprot:5918151-Pyramimonas_sp.AAC.1
MHLPTVYRSGLFLRPTASCQFVFASPAAPAAAGAAPGKPEAQSTGAHRHAPPLGSCLLFQFILSLPPHRPPPPPLPPSSSWTSFSCSPST